jgi:hypothetical protein
MKENTKKEKPHREYCIYCLGSGFILEDFPSNTAYRCRCSNGQSLPSFISTWNKPLVRKTLTDYELAEAARKKN